MEVRTTVVVPRKERKYTEAGSRLSNMYTNAKLFSLSWEVVSQVCPSERRDVFEKMKFLFIENGVHNVVDMDMFFAKMYDPKKIKLMSIMKGIEECLPDGEKNLLMANERMISNAISKFIFVSRDITSVGYLKQILNMAYIAFYDIGREWKWSSQLVIDDMTTGKQLFNTGNPLSDSSIRSIIEDFKKSGKRKTGQYTVKIENKKNDTGDDETVNMAKHGLPASVPIVYYIIMSLFSDLLTGLQRISDCRRLVNIANLIMMYAFCLHEGARPGDTMTALMHDKLIFHLGEEFPILALVFVKPKTLSYLILNGHLKEYVIQSWKGKDKKHYRGRYKSWFPPEYNMLCQVMIYIVMMKIILCLDKTSLGPLVFKAGLNISSLRQRKNESLGILNMSFYSIRYAAAEEDCAYNIPSLWIKWRMGHSLKSVIRFKYANNLDMRVTMDNVRALLGSDVSSSPNDNSVPLECKMFDGNVVIDTQKVSNVPTDIMDELKQIKKAIRTFFEHGGSLANYPELTTSLSIQDLLSDLKMLPLGCYFQFKEGMLSEKQQHVLKNNQETIMGFFERVSVPRLIPVVWSYAQVMYGVWHNDFKAKAVKDFNAIQAQETIAQIKNMLESAEGKPKMPQKTIQNMFKDGTNSRSRKKHIAKEGSYVLDKKAKRQKTKQWDLEIGVFNDENSWHMMNIEVDNVVAIICGEAYDNTSIKVPNTEHFIWLCKVVSIEKLSYGEITTYLYKGDIYNLSLDSSISTNILFKETSIVSIFEHDEHEEFSLTQENIDDMIIFIQSHYH